MDGFYFTDVKNPHLRDRTFVITNAKGDFQTQRGVPLLALIHPFVNGDVLNLKFVGNEEQEEDEIAIKFPIHEGNNNKLVRYVKLFVRKIGTYQLFGP